MGLRLIDLPDLGPLYAPDAPAPWPGMMILHGSEGRGAGWSHRFAAILAAHGIAALPLGYGQGDVWGAGDIRDVDLSAIVAAGAALAARGDLTSLDLLGWSRGGELAMHLGAIGAGDLPFRRIAAHAPADTCQPAFDAAAFRAGHRGPEQSARAWRWPGHDDRLVPGQTIEIERFPRHVFLSVGTADAVWDHRMTLRLAERLREAGNPPDLFVAEGQGHAFDFATEPQLWARLTAFVTGA